MEANVSNRIATQIRLMRERAGLSQTELAKKLGTRQSAIARLEDPSYGKHSVTVLHKVAAFFEVATWVEFVSFSTLIHRTADLSPKKITPIPYNEEFESNGEPRVSLALRADGSLIGYMHYATPVGASNEVPMRPSMMPYSRPSFFEG